MSRSKSVISSGTSIRGDRLLSVVVVSDGFRGEEIGGFSRVTVRSGTIRVPVSRVRPVFVPFRS